MERESHLLPEHFIHVCCYFWRSSYLKIGRQTRLDIFICMYVPFKYWSVLQILLTKNNGPACAR